MSTNRRTAGARGHAPDTGSGTAGFSLVETMVALTVLAIGVLSVGHLMVTSQRHASHSRYETMAVSLTQEVKERIFSESFDDVKSIFDGADTDDPGTINTSTDEWAAHVADMYGSNGRGTVNVVDDLEDPAIPKGMYRVEITISWVDGPHNRTLDNTFMMTKVGL